MWVFTRCGFYSIDYASRPGCSSDSRSVSVRSLLSGIWTSTGTFSEA